MSKIKNIQIFHREFGSIDIDNPVFIKLDEHANITLLVVKTQNNKMMFYPFTEIYFYGITYED